WWVRDDERDLLAIRRPRARTSNGESRAHGDLLGSRAVGAGEVEANAVVIVLVRAAKDDPFPVGREERRNGEANAGLKLAQAAPIGVDFPQVRGVLVLANKEEPLAVRRPAR